MAKSKAHSEWEGVAEAVNQSDDKSQEQPNEVPLLTSIQIVLDPNSYTLDRRRGRWGIHARQSFDINFLFDASS
jgi:hypothetical protein